MLIGFPRVDKNRLGEPDFSISVSLDTRRLTSLAGRHNPLKKHSVCRAACRGTYLIDRDDELYEIAYRLCAVTWFYSPARGTGCYREKTAARPTACVFGALGSDSTNYYYYWMRQQTAAIPVPTSSLTLMPLDRSRHF